MSVPTTTKMARSITMLETRSMSYSTSALSNKGGRVGSPKTRGTSTSPSISAERVQPMVLITMTSNSSASSASSAGATRTQWKRPTFSAASVNTSYTATGRLRRFPAYKLAYFSATTPTLSIPT